MIWIALAGVSIAVGWVFGRGDAEANLAAARATSPLWGLVLLLGLTAGGYGRDRVRLRRTYASPTRSWLAKVLLFAGLLSGLTFISAPVDWSPESLPWLAGLAASGLAFWMGNLPEKL